MSVDYMCAVDNCFCCVIEFWYWKGGIYWITSLVSYHLRVLDIGNVFFCISAAVQYSTVQYCTVSLESLNRSSSLAGSLGCTSYEIELTLNAFSAKTAVSQTCYYTLSLLYNTVQYSTVQYNTVCIHHVHHNCDIINMLMHCMWLPLADRISSNTVQYGIL
jgi:hypothetical protein